MPPAIQLGLGRQNPEASLRAPDPSSVGGEIASIESEDSCRAQSLCGNDQRRIREIHGVVGILIHELEGPSQRASIEKPHDGPIALQELAERRCSLATWVEQMKSLCENGLRGYEGLAHTFQDLASFGMSVVLRIKQGHEWPGVHQDHRRERLCWSTLRIACLALRADASAYPPGPRSSCS
jgi:hypothetical protein